MAKEPVFVIHGVGNSDEEKFRENVAALAKGIGDEWDFVPVFWDRLGSSPDGITAAIPPFSLGSGTRDAQSLNGASANPNSPGAHLLNAVAGRSASDDRTIVRDDGSSVTVVADAAAATVASGAQGTRAPAEGDAEAVRVAVQRVWGELSYLPYVKDVRILTEVGSLVGAASAESTKPAEAGIATRAGLDPFRLVKAVLHVTDRIFGAVEGVVGEGLLWAIRTALIPMFAKGAGDVLVYQAHRQEIGAIVRQKLAEHDATLGTDGRPALVIGHSLGGIIAVDLAVGADPIHWSALVTFGSQSSILHVLDPRNSPDLPEFVPKPYTPVRLPRTIGHWTNLYEPWDPLAFYAGKVFDSESKTRISDIEVPHLDSAGLWTHSAYWRDDFTAREIKRALAASRTS